VNEYRRPFFNLNFNDDFSYLASFDIICIIIYDNVYNYESKSNPVH
jgi:hypothetical protein